MNFFFFKYLFYMVTLALNLFCSLKKTIIDIKNLEATNYFFDHRWWIKYKGLVIIDLAFTNPASTNLPNAKLYIGKYRVHGVVV
jgi:hypothetical protein